MIVHVSTCAPNANVQQRPHVFDRSKYVKDAKLVEDVCKC